MNYGSMGFTIGHEFTHGFDDSGNLQKSIIKLNQILETICHLSHVTCHMSLFTSRFSHVIVTCDSDNLSFEFYYHKESVVCFLSILNSRISFYVFHVLFIHQVVIMVWMVCSTPGGQMSLKRTIKQLRVAMRNSTALWRLQLMVLMILIWQVTCGDMR